MLIEQTVKLKKIRALSGHANMKTILDVYGHLLEEAEAGPREAIGLLRRLSRAAPPALVAAD